MPGTYFKSGSWNIICDVCGFKFKETEVKKRWDGLIVCDKDFEYDHPQKYIRVRADGQAVDPIRDRPEDNFLDVCYLYERGAYADLGTADCMVADNTTFSYAFLLGLKTAGPT